MKSCLILCCSLSMIITSCTPTQTQQNTAPTQNEILLIVTAPSTPRTEKEWVVNSTADSGNGSLRWAMDNAQSGDNIFFDPEVFLSNDPQIIEVGSQLPVIDQNGITIDASDAGVILDGINMGEWTPAFQIDSKNNIIRGIHIQNFSGAGFLIAPGADGNIIGGDRETGAAQFGQGNVIVNCSDGLIIQSKGNTIIGNLIGTDGSERSDSGNRAPGIALEMQASDNVIGPNNSIAYNGIDGGAGVEFRSIEAINNRVTANAMFNNKDGSIFYIDTAKNMETSATIPTILEFDLAVGFVNGFTCPNCIVEIFSSNSTEGEKFEGLTTADALGFFELQKEENFEGPYLLANSFNDGQNSSLICGSTFGEEARSHEIQANNLHNPQFLPLLSGTQLIKNKLGEMQHVGPEEGLDFTEYANRANQLGYKWVRISLDWYDWDEVFQTSEYSKLKFTSNQEKAIELLYTEGIEIYYTIVYWDPQIQLSDDYRRFKEEEEIERFLDYVRFIANKFKGKIQWYSLLNESNCFDGQRAVRPQEYIELAKRVIPVVKEIDPSANVVLGDVSPFFDCDSFNYLSQIVTSDVMALADGIAWHGSSGLSLEYNPQAYLEYPEQVNLIVEEALAHGFKGQFFANEIGFRTASTPDPFGYNKYIYSPTVAAKYYARGIVFHQGKGFYTNIGLEDYTSIPSIKNTVTSLATILAETEPVNLSATIESSAVNIYQFDFQYSNGNYLLALWSDQQAIDGDPAIPTDIYFALENIQTITAIDPLYSYQKELDFKEENGQIAIKDFLLKDYPIFLKLQKLQAE
jgi:hypothetical protein